MIIPRNMRNMTEEEMNEIWQDATPEEQLGILAEDADAAWEEALYRADQMISEADNGKTL